MVTIGRVSIGRGGITIAPKPPKPAPKPSPSTGDSSSFERGGGGTSTPTPSPTPSPKPKPSRGGGGYSNVPQVGSAVVTTAEAQDMGKTSVPTTIVNPVTNLKGGVGSASNVNLKTYTAGSYIGGTGDRFGDGGVSGAPILPTISDKIKYQYEKADIAMGGYLPGGATPSQISARNSAQANAQSYIETKNKFRDADTQTIVSAIAPSYRSFAGFDKTNKNALKDLLAEKITQRFEETKKAELQQAVDNRIKNAQDKLNTNFNDLQARVNEGALDIKDAENAYKQLTEQAQKDLENSVTELEKKWYEERGKLIIASDTRLLSDVNFAKSLDKSLSAKSLAKTAVVASAIVATGGVASAGLFGSAVASTAPSVLTGLGVVSGAGLVYQGATTAQNLIELKQQGLLTRTAVIANIAPFITHTIVGVGSAVATGVALTPLRTSLINKEANKFQKDLLKSETLQKQYWTPENIKQGYFIKKINGVEVRFTTPSVRQISALEIAKSSKGMPEIVKTQSTGSFGERQKITNLILKDKDIVLMVKKEGVNIDTAEIGKFWRKNNYGKLEEWNYIRQASMVDKSGNSIAIAFKVTSSGKIVSTRITKFNIEDNQVIGNLFRPAYPSEKQISKYGVSGRPEKIEVYKAGELKLLKRVQQISKDKVISIKEAGDKTIIETEQSGLLFKVGKGGGKTTTISEQLNTQDSLGIFTRTKPELLARSGSQIKIIKNGDKGLFATRGYVTTNIPKTKPTGLIFNKVISKSMKIFPEDVIQIKPVSQAKPDFLTKPVERFLPEIKPADTTQNIPSMVEMGRVGEGLYTFSPSTINILSSPTSQYGNILSLNLPRFKTPSISTKITFAENLFVKPSRLLVYDSGLINVNKGRTTEGVLRGRTTILSDMKILPPQVTFKAMENIKPVTKTLTGSYLGFKQTSALATIPKLMNQQIFKPMVPLKPLRTEKPFIPKEPTPFFGLPNLGEIQTGGGERVRGKREGLFGKTSYTASIGSVLLRAPKKKVTAEEYAQLSKKKYLGLGLRPQVEVVSKKKKSALGLF